MKQASSLFIAGLILGSALSSDVAFAAEAAKNSIGFNVENFVGESGKSADGFYGFGISLKGERGAGIIRTSLGGTFQYSPGQVQFTSGPSNSTLYLADLSVGIIIIPMGDLQISPYFEISGTLGMANLQLSPPPVGSGIQSLSLTYGYQGSIGVQFPLSQQKKLRFAASYIVRSAQKLANTNRFGLNSLGFGVSLLF